MAKRYIALRKIQLAGGGTAELGEEVPGAAEWRNVEVYVSSRYIREATEDDDLPTANAPAAPKVPPAPPGSGDAMAELKSILAAVLEYSSSHKISEITAAAAAAGVAVPDPLPRRKDALVTAILAESGLTL